MHSLRFLIHGVPARGVWKHQLSSAPELSEELGCRFSFVSKFRRVLRLASVVSMNRDKSQNRKNECTGQELNLPLSAEWWLGWPGGISTKSTSDATSQSGRSISRWLHHKTKLLDEGQGSRLPVLTQIITQNSTVQEIGLHSHPLEFRCRKWWYLMICTGWLSRSGRHVVFENTEEGNLLARSRRNLELHSEIVWCGKAAWLMEHKNSKRMGPVHCSIVYKISITHLNTE